MACREHLGGMEDGGVLPPCGSESQAEFLVEDSDALGKGGGLSEALPKAPRGVSPNVVEGRRGGSPRLNSRSMHPSGRTRVTSSATGSHRHWNVQ